MYCQGFELGLTKCKASSLMLLLCLVHHVHFREEIGVGRFHCLLHITIKCSFGKFEVAVAIDALEGTVQTLSSQYL